MPFEFGEAESFAQMTVLPLTGLPQRGRTTFLGSMQVHFQSTVPSSCTKNPDFFVQSPLIKRGKIRKSR
jgi:hypothetical protein